MSLYFHHYQTVYRFWNVKRQQHLYEMLYLDLFPIYTFVYLHSHENSRLFILSSSTIIGKRRNATIQEHFQRIHKLYS